MQNSREDGDNDAPIALTREDFSKSAGGHHPIIQSLAEKQGCTPEDLMWQMYQLFLKQSQKTP